MTLLILAQHGLIGSMADASRSHLSVRHGGPAAILRGAWSAQEGDLSAEETHRLARGVDP